MRITVSVFLYLMFSCILYAQDRNQQHDDELLAAQFLRNGDFEKAVVLYEELFEKNPTPVIYNNYLICLLELNEFRKAERLVNSQIQKSPGTIRFEVDLGFVYTRANDSRKARRHMEGLIRNLSGHPSSVADLANAFQFRDFEDYALQTYLKGRSILGISFPFNIQIAEIYKKRGNYNEMMKEYIDLIEIDISHLEKIQAILQDELNNDPDFTKNDALKQVLLQKSQLASSQTIFSELLLWLSIQQKDFSMALRQARAIDRRLRQDGELVMEVAILSASNKNFDIAKQSYQYIIDRGDLNPYYLEARMGMLNVKYQEATSGYDINASILKEVESEYHTMITEMGLTLQSVGLIRNLARLKAFYLGNTQEAVQLLNSIINISNLANRIKAECRVELADILLLQGDLWDAHLLYAQVDKSFRDDPLAHEARFKNARLSFYMGEFKWAKAQLDVLKAATSRLIANDAMALSLLIQDNLEPDGTSVPLQIFARAEMHTFMNKFGLAVSTLDSIRQRFPAHQINDDVMMAKSNILIRTGNYKEADNILNDIAQLYPLGLHAADALFKRAELHEKVFQDKEKAMELYRRIIIDYPGSLNTVNARKNFRELRGDATIEEKFFYGNPIN